MPSTRSWISPPGGSEGGDLGAGAGDLLPGFSGYADPGDRFAEEAERALKAAGDPPGGIERDEDRRHQNAMKDFLDREREDRKAVEQQRPADTGGGIGSLRHRVQ